MSECGQGQGDAAGVAGDPAPAPLLRDVGRGALPHVGSSTRSPGRCHQEATLDYFIVVCTT